MIHQIHSSKLKRIICLTAAILLLDFTTQIVAKPSRSKVQVQMIEDLIRRGDYERSVDELVEVEFDSSLSIETRFAAAIIQSRLFELSNKSETSIRLLQRFRDRNAESVSQPIKKSLITEQMRLFLKLEQISAAEKMNEELEKKDRVVFKSPEQLHDESDAFTSSPYVFAAASTFVPGLGQALQGRPKDTLSSLFMISIPLYFAFEARRNDEHTTANAAFFLSSFFYLGNIASSYNTARLRLEKKSKKNWLEYVDATINPVFSRARGQLGLSIKIDAALK